jgi:hypothetical protein
MATSLITQELYSDLAFVERQLAKHPDAYDTTRLMWQQRKQTLLDEIAEAEGHVDNFARVFLVFKGEPVRGSEEIRLDFATKALESYQAVIGSVGAVRVGNELGTRGPLPSAFSSKLYLRDMLRGSVGFVIEEARPAQYRLLPSLAKQSVEQASEIIKEMSRGDTVAFETRMRELSPRTVGAIKRFAKVLLDAGAETQIVTANTELTLTNESTGVLLSLFNEIEATERRERRDGVLLGLFPERRQYEFRSFGDSPVFYGPVSEGLGARYMENPEFARSIILKPVAATFLVVSTIRAGVLQREELVLEDASPLATQLPGPPNSGR